MASTLSPSAIHRIISLVLGGPKWYPSYEITSVHSKWKAIYDIYTDVRPVPPLDYLDSLEMTLILKDQVDDKDVHTIFMHGKPLKFWGCPRLLVSKIVEAFRELREELSCLDITIASLPLCREVRPSEAWPEVFTTHLPCYACSTVETVQDCPGKAVDFAIQKFHVSSERFRKRLALELHYELVEGMTATEREQSSVIHKITIQLSSETCLAQGRLCGTANRSSATCMLIPDFASEVFGFLERAHVGSSLLANRDLRDVICQLKHRLPVHHLTCNFEEDETLSVGWKREFSGAYWLEIRHFQRDLSYTEVRRFKVPSTAGAEYDSALIRHYLSNSHVADLRPAESCFPFSIKMLAGLASQNLSIGHVYLSTDDDDKRLSDYRSMDTIFGGMRISSLALSCEESCFVELVKTTDFFRMPTVQRLRELELNLYESRDKEEEPREHARSKSPLWISGIHLLRNCAFYQVDYSSHRHLRSIERKVVRLCEVRSKYHQRRMNANKWQT
ncbi:hypothetical protein AAVH_16575 [Aphelenchoides avenae]|nr:hypothetical protein AAVH_16575 [Aphelenchus avenae]